MGEITQVEAKPFWASKTIWGNVLAVLALSFQSKIGLTLSAEEQIMILGVINIILRTVTKGKVTLS